MDEDASVEEYVVDIIAEILLTGAFALLLLLSLILLHYAHSLMILVVVCVNNLEATRRVDAEVSS